MSKTTNVTEIEHLSKVNKIFAFVLFGHIPVSLLFAFFYDTGMTFALLASIAICSLPIYLTFFTQKYRLASLTQCIGLMFFSGLLIHLSKGMIETHFHIFVCLAAMIVYANPLIILAATLTIAVHHIGFYFLLPASVFNYQATFGIVLIHAVYVVVETIPCMWIAKKFGDYIIKQGVVVQQIDEIFKMMNQSILELTDSNDIVARDTTLQTEVVTKTAEVANEIGIMAAATTTNASDSRKISEETTDRATLGMKSMQELTEAFMKIKNSNKTLAEQIEVYTNQLNDIVTNMREIANKTSIINDIVFQTKLLSFNASVESARAGEHGKGFAVVAEEVGNLAAMSGNASKEINSLININVVKVEQIAESTKKKVTDILKESKDCISDGEIKTNQTAKNFDELTVYLKDLNSRVTDISRASLEQGTGIERITSAISELESVNQRATKAQTISNDVSKNLSVLACNLGELVKKLVDEKKEGPTERPH